MSGSKGSGEEPDPVRRPGREHGMSVLVEEEEIGGQNFWHSGWIYWPDDSVLPTFPGASGDQFLLITTEKSDCVSLLIQLVYDFQGCCRAVALNLWTTAPAGVMYQIVTLQFLGAAKLQL